VCSCGAEAQWQWEPREGHATCVCPYVGIGVVSWTGGTSRCPRGAMRGTSAPYLCGYAHVRAALDGGLHSMLSTAAAWPVKRAARGPHRRAPGAASPAGAATAAERAAAVLM
jgi:hypothetical protein